MLEHILRKMPHLQMQDINFFIIMVFLVKFIVDQHYLPKLWIYSFDLLIIMLSVTISNLDSFVSYTVSFLVMQILKIIIDSCSKYSSKKNQYDFTIRNITVWQTHSEEPIRHLLHKSLGSAFDLLFLISSDDCLICFD